jgi:hypothetical protein
MITEDEHLKGRLSFCGEGVRSRARDSRAIVYTWSEKRENLSSFPFSFMIS